MSPETTTITQNATLIQPSAAPALALWGMYMIAPVQHTAKQLSPHFQWVSKSVEALAILHQNSPTSLRIKPYLQRMQKVLNAIFSVENYSSF